MGVLFDGPGLLRLTALGSRVNVVLEGLVEASADWFCVVHDDELVDVLDGLLLGELGPKRHALALQGFGPRCPQRGALLDRLPERLQLILDLCNPRALLPQKSETDTKCKHWAQVIV